MGYLKYLSHTSLLICRTVILDGKDYGIGGTDKGASIDRFHDRAKWYFCSECVAVINQRGSIVTIVTIEFYTATPG